MQAFLDRYPHLKSFLLPISIGSIGLVCIIIGLTVTFWPHEQSNTNSSFDAIPSKAVAGVSIFPVGAGKIVVDIEGAVVKQGIYRLALNARLQDALIAAGGLSEKADREFVAKHINLAQKLVDGQKIYIPAIGESASFSTASDSQTTSDTSTGLININDASADQLDGLPGVGPVTAQKIIANRPYADLQDLLNKKVVSNSVFEKIKDKISLY